MTAMFSINADSVISTSSRDGARPLSAKARWMEPNKSWLTNCRAETLTETMTSSGQLAAIRQAS